MKYFVLNLKKMITQISVLLSLFTMVLSPVALGKEAENISKQQIQDALNQMGLNKSMTVGEFLEKNRNLFPPRILKEIEPILTEYKNVKMPEVKVTTVKSTDGRDIPNVSFLQNEILINAQWFGEQDRFVKIQNTNLTEVDLVNFKDMIGRLYHGDSSFRPKSSEIKSSNKTNLNKSEYTGFPILDASTWKQMSLKERVSYMVQLKHLWLEAKNVLIEKELAAKKKKSASLENSHFFQEAWLYLLGSQAEAAGRKEGPKATKATKTQAAADVSSGQSCLVAGYVASYKGGVCDHTLINESYVNDSVKSAQQQCSSGEFACNPLVYGMPDGKAICVSLKSSSFQEATHFKGPCDTKSRLQHSSEKISLLKDESKKIDRYSADNLKMSDDERREYFRKDQAPNYKETEDFISGILKSKNKSLTSLYVDGVLTADAHRELTEIQGQFDREIKQSTEACALAAKDPKAKHEKNFLGACDQLHKRFLFIAELLGSKCKDGSAINQNNLKCTCTDADKTEVFPGASCKKTEKQKPEEPPVTPKQPKQKKTSDKVCEDGYVLEKGTVAPEEAGPSAGAVIEPRCVPAAAKKQPPVKKEEECGIGCELLKFTKKYVLPLALVAAVGYGIYYLFKAKKPALNGAADLCPGTTVSAPCPNSCYPKANINGVCQCALCPAGQSISDAATCTCSTTTTTYTCWDGSKVTDAAKCPTQTYKCDDGTVVTNKLNCPVKITIDPTKPVTETGTGR